jgi:hypothetical protein
MLHAVLRSARTVVLSAATLAVLTCPTAADPPDAMDLDVHAPHRHAEAARKAEAATRWSDALGRVTVDPNQERWDVTFVDLDLSFDVGTEGVSGRVGFETTVVDGPIDRVVVDLDDAMTVTAVGGAGTGFVHSLDRIDIALDRAYDTGERVVFHVDYQGVPDQSIGSFGVQSVSGQPLIWSLSEPFGARAWWPCKDMPADKADSASIKFTVPSNLTAVSNGTLERVVDLGATKRYEWFERYPITTYLISIAAYPYTEQTLSWQSSTGTTMPVTVWSFPDQASSALNAAHTTRDMLTAFESMFGPYPFLTEKYGQAQFTWGGGMEHQTASSMCCWGIDFLIAHELAHQWYGNQVTCTDFTEIWVNEGFATYSEALWREVSEGRAGYVDEMLAARYLGAGTIRVPEDGLDDFARIFSADLSYDKASWVLHMLRYVMGDQDFFDFMKAYASDPNVTYGVAGTDDVRRVAEQVSGLDLSTFFAQWIELPWYPTFQLDWTPTPTGVDVELRQVQTHHVYDTPITLRVVDELGTTDHVVQLDEAVESFAFAADAAVTDVVIDPDHWVLHAVEPQIEAPTFDRGILLVNGVDWDTYRFTIEPAYQDSVFTGQQPFEFWDVIPAPSYGYPSSLPAPRGTGAIPSDVLGEYSTVVWVGNDYLGDLEPWLEAAVLDYLEKGGNLLLLTRRGANFLTQPRQDYLGVELSDVVYQTVGDATPDLAGLVPMTATGTQNLASPLSTAFTQAETVNLFVDSSDPGRSLGAWRRPVEGGSVRPSGGHFAHVVGRPYRWDRTALRQNTEFILTGLIGEPMATDVETVPRTRTAIRGAVPNPFNPRVSIEYALEHEARVTIEVFDVRGRRVRMLLDEVRPQGDGSILWNGLDDTGQAVASGVYTVRLRSGDTLDHTKVTLVR